MAEGDPLYEARALLRTFLNSDWKACHVTTDRLMLFASRDPAIRAGQASTAPAPSPDIVAQLTAPHLGTIVALAASGTKLNAGDVFGRLAVLDEERQLVAEHSGTVALQCEQPGALVQFGQPLLSLAA